MRLVLFFAVVLAAFVGVLGPANSSLAQYLLFREMNDGIPGWDHCAFEADGNVWESHPPYKAVFPEGCGGLFPHMYWDPLLEQYKLIPSIDGVQWFHALGSFAHCSTSPSGSIVAGFEKIAIDANLAQCMAEEAYLRSGSKFGYIDITSLQGIARTLWPSVQKGANGTFTCVGLVEYAAEQAGLNGGQGFIPDVLEYPILTPSHLYWAATAGNAVFAVKNWLKGFFDPVDFILTDPLGRRLGYSPELGLLNEIPGALYSGDGDPEEFFIPDPLPGEYHLDLFGTGQDAFAVFGTPGAEVTFEGTLAPGQSEAIVVEVVPEPATLSLLALGGLALLHRRRGASS